MPAYLCQWSIEVDAESPEQAALLAESLMHGREESGWHVLAEGRSKPAEIDVTIWKRALAEALAGNVVIAVGWMYDDDPDGDGQILGYCPASHVGPALVHTVLATIDPKDYKPTRRAKR